MRPVMKSRDLSTMGKTRETARKFARHATLGEIENSKTKVRVTYSFCFQFDHAARITACILLSLSCILSFTHQSVAKTNFNFKKNNNNSKINLFGFVLIYSGQFFIIIFVNLIYHNSLPNTGLDKLVSIRPCLARSAELGLVTPEGLSTKLGISTA